MAFKPDWTKTAVSAKHPKRIGPASKSPKKEQTHATVSRAHHPSRQHTASSPPLGIWGGGGVGNYPDAGFPGPQPGQPPRPWGPINYPDQGLPGQLPPLGIWGGGGVGNYPDAGFPGPQPGQPPRPWGPINYPDQGLPQPQPPISGGGRPTHPIYYPPVIWDPSRPTNPITNPGDPNNPGAGQPGGGGGGNQPLIEWKTAWSPVDRLGCRRRADRRAHVHALAKPKRRRSLAVTAMTGDAW
jgi:hypothetical protein